MGTTIRFTNDRLEPITNQQVSRLNDYHKQFFENDVLKKIEYININRISNEASLKGGVYYVSTDEDVEEVKLQNLRSGKNWLFYFNRVPNGNGELLWDYEWHNYGSIRKGKEAFDSRGRKIADCEIDLSTNQFVGKRKFYYGDPAIFKTFSTGNLPAMTFSYDDYSDEMITVYCEFNNEDDNEYSVDEFLEQEQIMNIFSWENNSYYHYFQPMLPNFEGSNYF